MIELNVYKTGLNNTSKKRVKLTKKFLVLFITETY